MPWFVALSFFPPPSPKRFYFRAAGGAEMEDAAEEEGRRPTFARSAAGARIRDDALSKLEADKIRHSQRSYCSRLMGWAGQIGASTVDPYVQLEIRPWNLQHTTCIMVDAGPEVTFKITDKNTMTRRLPKYDSLRPAHASPTLVVRVWKAKRFLSDYRIGVAELDLKPVIEAASGETREETLILMDKSVKEQSGSRASQTPTAEYAGDVTLLLRYSKEGNELEITVRSAAHLAQEMDETPDNPTAGSSMALKALLIVLVYLVGGVIYYVNVEGWSNTDALYFGFVTLTTVGYGESKPSPNSGGSELFTTFEDSRGPPTPT